MNVLFWKRIGEESTHAFIGGFSAAALAAGGGLDKALLIGGLVAGVRAVLGVLAMNFGDHDKPSVL